MVLACGVSQYSVALYHLLNHAYFKALLFLSAGCIIHGVGDEQDVRKMGGMVKVIPMIYTCVLIGSLSLMALPYLSGYYSKDMILEVSYSQYRLNGRVTNWLGLITATITSLYTIRMMSYTFFNSPNGRFEVYDEMRNSEGKKEWVYMIPLMILAMGSIYLGYLTKEVFVGVGTTYMSSMFVHPINNIGIEVEEIRGYIKLLPVVATLMGGVVYVVLRVGRIKVSMGGVGVRYRGRWMNMIVGRMLKGYDWWDNIYNGIVISGGSKVSYMMVKIVDKGVLEVMGPLGLRRVFGRVSRRMMELDSGYIPHYGLYIIIGTMIIIMSMMGGVTGIV